MSDLEIEMPIWHHLEDLRGVLFRIFICLLAGFLLAFCFYKPLITFLTAPLSNDAITISSIQKERVQNEGHSDLIYHLPEDAVILTVPAKIIQKSARTYVIPPQTYLEYEKPLQKNGLIVLSPFEGLSATCKVCFWISLVGTSPLWMLWILQFVAPALRSYEKRLLLPFLFLSACFIALGFAFAYFITIPLANVYFLTFNDGLAQNLWSLSHYLDYTLFIILANGLAFEIAVIGFFLVHLGIFTAQKLASKRRHSILLAFILAAVLTPPDVLSQILMAIPLVILYELLIFYAFIREKLILSNREYGESRNAL